MISQIIIADICNTFGINEAFGRIYNEINLQHGVGLIGLKCNFIILIISKYNKVHILLHM